MPEQRLEPVLNPQTIQIRTPHRIPAEELRPYLRNNKTVVCLTRHKRPIMATLSAIRDDHLVATILNRDALKLIRWKGEPIAVILSGVRLAIEGQHAQDYHTHKVVTITISLPHVPQMQEMQGAQDSRELSVLSVIRNVRQAKTEESA